MAESQRPHPIEAFAAFLKREGVELDAEMVADMLWLARHIRPAPGSQGAQPSPETQNVAAGGPARQVRAAPRKPPQKQDKTAKFTPPSPESDRPSHQGEGLGPGLPVQLTAARALRAQLDLERALRPLMAKIPSRTEAEIDTEATAERAVVQNILSPVLMPARECRYDLALVVEESPSLQIWTEAIAEVQALVERQGAFRQVRTWLLRQQEPQGLEVGSNWKQPRSFRRAEGLKDPTRRQIVWLVSDCTSVLWQHGTIYRLLQDWGRDSPLAIVQLFPERLWSRTALGMAQLVRFEARGAWASQAEIAKQVRPAYPEFWDEGEIAKNGDRVALPVMSLEPEPWKRWSLVTAGTAGVQVSGYAVEPGALSPQGTEGGEVDLTPKQRVRRFRATASIQAQQLAGLMTAGPVYLPVVHLIQETMLPESRQVHVAEVFMGGLVEAVRAAAGQPLQFRFIEGVWEELIVTLTVPISETRAAMDVVAAWYLESLSPYIAERLGKGTKTFPALIAVLAGLPAEQRSMVRPFAEIGIERLKYLGGEQRMLAEELERQLAGLPSGPKGRPPLRQFSYQVATVAVEPLQRFEFESVLLSFRDGKLRSTVSPGSGWQRLEDLGNGVVLEMVEIVGGKFLMGSPEKEAERMEREGPRHQVTVGDFFMGKYPVTQAQWRAIAALPQIARLLEPAPSGFKGDNRPVEQVSWEEAVEFCARLTVKTGRIYRLPTEAEWEYACRAGKRTPFHFGETITTDLANYNGLSEEYGSYGRGPKGVYRGETTEVGSFKVANGFGLYDMHGNVWEWCQDQYHDGYEGKPEELKKNGNQPWLTEGEESIYVLRGGSWDFNPRYCRSAICYSDFPDARYYSYGFRVVSEAARAQA